MKTFRRLDVFEDELGSVKRTDEGFAHFFARATRTGVFLYKNSDGSIRRELRLPEEVFKKDSMETLQNKPITNDHPEELVDAKNSRYFTVGMTGESVKKDGKFIKTKAIITDSDTIKDVVEKGKVQVSCGYTCEHEVKSGTFDGESFDVIQRNIKYNHLAIVDTGRAGPDVRLRLDSGDAIMVEDENLSVNKLIFDDQCDKKDDDNKLKEDKVMPKIVIDGIEQEVSEEFKKAFDAKDKEKEKKQEDEGKEEMKKKDSVISKLQAEIDSLKAKQDSEDEASKKEKMDAEVNEKVKARLKLYDAAKERCSEEIVSKLDGLSDLDIKKEVIKTTLKADSGINLDEKDEIYIDTRFDIVMEDAGIKKEDASDKLGEHIVKSRSSEKKDSIKNSEDERLNAWKKPLAASKADLMKIR